MLVISYGMAKSGSTLAYELVKGVLESAGYSAAKKLKGAPGLKPGSRANHLASVDRDDLAALIDEIRTGQDRSPPRRTRSSTIPRSRGWRSSSACAASRSSRPIAIHATSACRWSIMA